VGAGCPGNLPRPKFVNAGLAPHQARGSNRFPGRCGPSPRLRVGESATRPLATRGSALPSGFANRKDLFRHPTFAQEVDFPFRLCGLTVSMSVAVRTTD
jgi:hypothetical protein